MYNIIFENIFFFKQLGYELKRALFGFESKVRESFEMKKADNLERKNT